MKNLGDSGERARSGRFRSVTILAILLFIIGLAALIFSIVDLFHGRSRVSNYNESQGGLKVENPLWPSSGPPSCSTMSFIPLSNLSSCLGKGFWVGLVLMSTSFVGFLSSREGTRSSIIGFTILTTISTILCFYLMITSIIPVQYDQQSSSRSRPRWQSNELILNSLLIAAGALGFLISAIASIVGCLSTDCCRDQRHSLLFTPDADQVAGGPSAPTFSPGNGSRLAYPYQQGDLRMPM